MAVGYNDKPYKAIVPHELSNPKECGLSEDEQMEILLLVQQLADLPEADQRTMQWDSDCRILAFQTRDATFLDFLPECSGSEVVL